MRTNIPKQGIGTETLRNCVCTRCNFSMPAPLGVDCSQVKCPKCGDSMRVGGTAIAPLEAHE